MQRDSLLKNIAKKLDERPHAKRGNDRAQADNRPGEKTDENCEYVAGDTAPAQLDMGSLGKNKADTVIRRNAEPRIHIKRGGKSQNHNAAEHTYKPQKNGWVSGQDVSENTTVKIDQIPNGNHVHNSAESN